MSKNSYEHIEGGRVPIKAWTKGVHFDENAKEQLRNMASLPFVFSHVAVMPDVHLGKGATVGSVVATKNAIVPSSVGVDIGCGMMARQTSLKASDLPDNLFELRSQIERNIPHGFVTVQGRSKKGNWEIAPNSVESKWKKLNDRYDLLVQKHPQIEHERPHLQLGSLGGGNHFIEICLDENQNVWVMLHSGSRGAGNRIGTYFIDKAKREMERMFISLPDKDLAYLAEGSTMYDDYMEALSWAQEYALMNRECMMEIVLNTMHRLLPPFQMGKVAVNCHHNYVEKEHHFGQNVLVTRKGAVRARKGEYGIIPGSMGAKSFIVRGKGNEQSFCSCSHGAGRVMSRGQAAKLITVDDHIKATEGVECRKDDGVIDESPAAYKDIDAVMLAQDDLVEIVHTLKQVLCVKG